MKQLLNLRKKEQKRTIKVDFKATKDKEIKNIVETTRDVVKGEDPLKQDAEDLFIYDDDDLFSYDEITPEDKKLICILLIELIFIAMNKFLTVMNTQELKLLVKILRSKKRMNRMTLKRMKKQ